MDKKTVLKEYFPEIDTFRGYQEEAINSLLSGNKVLCLMPTGEGKSLIYQVSGLCLEKTVVIISPLVALMRQQSNYLEKKGFSCLFMSGLDYKQQFKALNNIANGLVPSFIFISPERATNDGHLEFVLNLIKDKVGIIVVDEAHCISQWGDGFRPAYKRIPDFINRVFGINSWPPILCLTATLNIDEQKQVELDFGITETFKSTNLWRSNLNLKLINIGSGKDDKKDDALNHLLEEHKGEKILVFVHRKYGNKGTTRVLYDTYSTKYKGCAFFDADIPDSEKDRILDDFKDGNLKIVFATSAFGMGVDIPDIRVVVHYLIPESVEQYYQEVGRAGRDNKPAFGYLLYTKQSRNGRKRLIESSLCSEKLIKSEYEDRAIKNNDFGSINYYEGLTEERKLAFSLLAEFGVIDIMAKGVQNINCFKACGDQGELFLKSALNTSKTGLTKIISKKQNKYISSLSTEIWKLCCDEELKLVSAPSKALFYKINNPLNDQAIKIISDDQREKKEKRMIAFDYFADAIESGKSVEKLVKDVLNIP